MIFLYLLLYHTNNNSFVTIFAAVMKYKRFKTLTLEYMKKLPKLDNVDWVYYMDIDIMMGAPFDDLVNGLNEKYGIENTSSDGENDSPVSKLYMFKDPHATKFALNSGFIGMNRHTSERCLDVWREEMDSHPDAYFDQTTVNEIVNNRQDECEMVGMKHWQFLSYPGSDKSLDDMMRKSKFSHLIHIFNSCFAKRMSAETMEKFVGVVLQLSEEEKEQHKFGKVVITESKE